MLFYIYIISRSIIPLFVLGRTIKAQKSSHLLTHSLIATCGMCTWRHWRGSIWGVRNCTTFIRHPTKKEEDEENMNGKLLFCRTYIPYTKIYMRAQNKNSLNIFMNKMWGLRQIIDRIGMLRAWWQADKRRKKNCVWEENSSLLRSEFSAGRKKKKKFFPLFLKLAEKQKKYAVIKFNEFMIFPPFGFFGVKIHCKSRERALKKGRWWHSATIYDNSTRYWIWNGKLTKISFQLCVKNLNSENGKFLRERKCERVLELRHAQAHES